MATKASAVLTEESTVTCGHQGSVAPAGVARLKVNKHPVFVKASVTGTPVAPLSCTLTPSADSQGVIASKCTKVTGVTGQADKLKVRTPDGTFGVLTDPLAGTTDGINNRLGTADLTAKPVQTRLKAV